MLNRPVPQRSPEELIALRRRHLNPTLSLSYQEPLKIVRGEGAYLFDQHGKPYLDMVNNVCHVGHCHPEVVAAGAAQMALLNTNTRYLHDNLVEYALRLTETLPQSLSVVFMTNSGTEANDLALRIARAYTNAQDVIVLDHAYHGNSPSMIDLSPYKFNGRGGRGKPEHVQFVPMPDSYRDQNAQDADYAESHAAHIDSAISRIHARGEKPAVFYAEAMLGCGGQTVLPPGYLQQAYARVRAAGGVCLADEVQIGFGRDGEYFWSFQSHGVVPDIVTMGKPIGNGHPVGAVVTTPEIASAFVTGMEYFNTFSGNPVSCAIAMAVLEVVQEEKLQQNALETGAYLQQGLRQLAQQHNLIGDVRGRGLFLGAELVRDRDSKVAATAEAKRIVEMMKAQQILLSTDGPLDNVLKIKPPVVFQRSHADQFLHALDDALHRL
jgi:4-aminobutyrate aminotransferase-like enzyme